LRNVRRMVVEFTRLTHGIGGAERRGRKQTSGVWGKEERENHGIPA